MRQVIGLMGVKGAGKDTAATFLTQERGFIRMGFADKLYQEVAEAYGVSTTFLGNRDTKETPLPELCLARCVGEPGFVRCWQKLNPNAPEAQALWQPRSPREILQLWGTEYRRQSEGSDSYWIEPVRQALEANPLRSFVITDVRFENEQRFLKEEYGAILVRIRRPELEAKEAINRASKGTAAHSSEVALLNATVDVEVLNPEGQGEQLRMQMLQLADGVFA